MAGNVEGAVRTRVRWGQDRGGVFGGLSISVAAGGLRYPPPCLCNPSAPSQPGCQLGGGRKREEVGSQS